MSPPTVASAAASTATQNSVSRARTLSILNAGVLGEPERVSRAPSRVNQLHGSAVVDLAAQALDVDFDQVRHRIEAVVPDVLRDVGPADDLALPTEQLLE